MIKGGIRLFPPREESRVLRRKTTHRIRRIPTRRARDHEERNMSIPILMRTCISLLSSRIKRYRYFLIMQE